MGTDQGSNLVAIGTDDALRSWPISSVMETVSTTINNNTFSFNSRDIIQALLRYSGDLNLQDQDLSGTPAYLDQYADYNDYVTQGTARNPKLWD